MPTDDVMDTWTWEGALSVAQIMGVMGVRVAEDDAMASWLGSSRFADLKRGNKKEIKKN